MCLSFFFPNTELVSNLIFKLLHPIFYKCLLNCPPESYLEDYLDAQKLGTEEEVREYYFNMKSGAESGWDYSTKW